MMLATDVCGQRLPARAGRAAALVACVGLVAGSASPAAAQPSAAPVIEYVAHASVVVQSASGTRVVLDPFNSERWLGLTYPEGIAADAVLVSHPHYDHDASYYFPPGTPVFRRPGRYGVGDIRIEGHEGRHADPYGRDFDQVNTIWVVEADGVRVAHLGDNGPLTARTLAALGRIDVLLIPGDAQKHILSDEAIAAVRTFATPGLTIPMHYRHEGFRDLPKTLGPASLPGIEALPSHRLVLDRAMLATPGRVVMLRPSPEVRAWSEALAEAWDARDAAVASAAAPETQAAAAERRLIGLRRAATLAPSAVIFQVELAETLRDRGLVDEAVPVLERALAVADRQDVEYAMRGRMALAALYATRGATAQATALYRAVVAGSSRPAQVETARAFLRRP